MTANAFLLYAEFHSAPGVPPKMQGEQSLQNMRHPGCTGSETFPAYRKRNNNKVLLTAKNAFFLIVFVDIF